MRRRFLLGVDVLVLKCFFGWCSVANFVIPCLFVRYMARPASSNRDSILGSPAEGQGWKRVVVIVVSCLRKFHTAQRGLWSNINHLTTGRTSANTASSTNCPIWYFRIQIPRSRPYGGLPGSLSLSLQRQPPFRRKIAILTNCFFCATDLRSGPQPLDSLRRCLPHSRGNEGRRRRFVSKSVLRYICYLWRSAPIFPHWGRSPQSL